MQRLNYSRVVKYPDRAIPILDKALYWTLIIIRDDGDDDEVNDHDDQINEH